MRRNRLMRCLRKQADGGRSPTGLWVSFVAGELTAVLALDQMLRSMRAWTGFEQGSSRRAAPALRSFPLLPPGCLARRSKICFDFAATLLIDDFGEGKDRCR